MANSSLINNFTLPSINNLLANSVITHRPLIVVEGKDDIQFYDTICERVDRKFKIIAVENINGYTEGCDKVVNLTSDLQNMLISDTTLQSFYLGIIDKDVRNYRDKEKYNEINSYLNMFVLNYYSYESHYITSEIIRKIIKHFTFINNELLSDESVEIIFQEITSKILNLLYYPSLEALKNATVREYSTEVGYSDKLNTFIKNPLKVANIISKKNDLDTHATNFNLSKNFEDLKLFSKGKWVIECFSEEMKNILISLKENCKKGVINQCQYCESGAVDKCLYKVKPLLGNTNIASLILPFVDINETNYIFQKLKQLN